VRGDQAADDVSYISNTHFECLIDGAFGLSAVAAIQRKVVEQGKRNVISRHLHAKDDKEKIAAWRMDLVRILHVFNVRPIPSV